MLVFTGQQNRSTAYDFVYLFNNGDQRRGIAVHKLVWMAGADTTVPDGWEVHHEDEDHKNNVWGNLFCIHRRDHSKIHDWRRLEKESDDDIPF